MAPVTRAKKAAEKEAKPSSEQKTGMSNKQLMDRFNKQFGEGTFFTFAGTDRANVVPIPSGIPTFDYASGIGGIPSGRIIEIYGEESAGKTSLVLKIIANLQKLTRLPGPFFGKKVGYVDAEHALDPIHVAAIGVDVSEETGMIINQPDSGEGALDLMEAMCNSGEFALVACDSVAALVPLAELDNDNDYNPIGLQARMLGKGLRKLKGPANKSNTCCVFINQLREKPGIQGRVVKVTPGGKALRFYASMRIEVKAKPIVKSDFEIGLATTATFKKNKVARPFTFAEYDYYFDGGVDMMKSIMEVAVDTGVIHKAGAWYYFGSEPGNTKSVYVDGSGNELKWQGKENLFATLRESPALYKHTYDIVMGLIPKDAVFVDEEEDEEPDDLHEENEVEEREPTLL